MKYKLIAIDMDGTLLNSKNNVSQRTKEVIIEAKKKGIHIVLATGRILKSAKYYSKELELEGPIVASNGAIMIDENSNILFKKTFNKELAKEILQTAKQEDIYCHFYDESSFYSSQRVQEILDFYSEGSKDLNVNFKVFENIDEILYKENINIYKFIFIDDDSEKLKSFREKMTKINGISISSSWSNNIEAMGLNVSKGEAIKRLCNILNIKKEEVIAIGDNENDISMFEIAGLSVAMGNGSQLVKDRVDCVTDTNDNDGVAKVIEKLILGMGR